MAYNTYNNKNKISPNSLIHCTACGEDYSVTYKRCPFCGNRNAPPPTPPDPEPFQEPEMEEQPVSRRSAPSVNLEDTYVFSGQDLFDDEPEEDSAPVRPRGGKRLAERPSSNPFANADINWPRVITFVCSLVIIVAAMIIVFTVVYPQLRGDPTVESQSPSSPTGNPVGGNTQPVDPNATDPIWDNSDPVTVPSDNVPPAGSGELTAISFQRVGDADFTLQAGADHTIVLSFTPANWSGAVTWTSSDTQYATVDNNGKVTNVNTTNQLRSVTITASVGDLRVESKVYCRGASTATSEPPASEPPASQPPASNPPASQPPASGGRQGKVNSSSGLNVRSGPGTESDKVASLRNGTTVTILEEASGGWYKISFTSGGATKEGYVLGEYISTN